MFSRIRKYGGTMGGLGKTCVRHIRLFGYVYLCNGDNTKVDG